MVSPSPEFLLRVEDGFFVDNFFFLLDCCVHASWFFKVVLLFFQVAGRRTHITCGPAFPSSLLVSYTVYSVVICVNSRHCAPAGLRSLCVLLAYNPLCRCRRLKSMEILPVVSTGCLGASERAIEVVQVVCCEVILLSGHFECRVDFMLRNRILE